MTRYIGQSIPRFEDRRFLTGQGRYTDDYRLEGALHCAFVRSPHAHARILRIDAGEALRLPGVAAVLTGADYLADALGGIAHMPNGADVIDISLRSFMPPEQVLDLAHRPIAADRARYLGEAVAVVIAQTAALARDAAELVSVDYEPLPSVSSVVDALNEGAPQLWDQAPRNTCFSMEFGEAGTTGKTFASAPHVVRHEFTNSRIVNCQLEPRSALGVYDSGSGLHTLISGNQGVHTQRVALAAVLKVPIEQVRVVCPDVGGGFGPRTHLYAEQVAVVWAAKRLRRPVKWTSDRSEAFLADYQGRDSVARAALALDAEGRILAYDVDWYGNVGAHTVSYTAMGNARRVLPTVYQVPAFHLRVRGVLTNTVPTAPFRGAGRPEAHHLIERLLDMAARRIGIDRVEIRRRNIVGKGMMPYKTVTGITYDSGDFSGYMEKTLVLADWSGFPARKEQARARGRLAGIGIANHVEIPVGFPMERVVVRAAGEGIVDVIVGTQSTGQGHETSFAQIVADQFGVAIESIRIRYGDSEFVALGGGTHSDRSTRIAGAMMVRACAEIVDKGKSAAAALLEVAAEDIVFAEGVFRVSGTDRALSLFDVARAVEAGEAAPDLRQVLAASQDFRGRIPAYPGGSCVCELEVDPETGSVEITRYTLVDDVGQPINPMIIEGQAHGSIVQGVGQALREGAAIDPESGQVLTGSFMDYGISRADDLPSFRVGHAEDPTSGNPLRVKGGGEGGIVAATAVVHNALCDALAECGVEDVPMPATPLAIWEALKKRPWPKS